MHPRWSEDAKSGSSNVAKNVEPQHVQLDELAEGDEQALCDVGAIIVANSHSGWNWIAESSGY
eukprot:12406306-Karenia_brevis.AAC.1